MIGKTLYHWKDTPAWRAWKLKNRTRGERILGDYFPFVAIGGITAISSFWTQLSAVLPSDGSIENIPWLMVTLRSLPYPAMAIVCWLLIRFSFKKLNQTKYILAEDRICYGDLSKSILLSYDQIPGFYFVTETFEDQEFEFLILSMGKPERLAIAPWTDKNRITEILVNKGVPHCPELEKQQGN